jgi:DNA-binding MarR family transcriptional regulator
VAVAPSKDDVRSLVEALFPLATGLDRARRQRKGAAALSLLQALSGRSGVRIAELADLRVIHASRVTRQVQELKAKGYVQVAADPADRRALLVTLTAAGRQELWRLTQADLDQFTLLVADWEPSDVRTLAALLERLRQSMSAVSWSLVAAVDAGEEGQGADQALRTGPGEDGGYTEQVIAPRLL